MRKAQSLFNLGAALLFMLSILGACSKVEEGKPAENATNPSSEPSTRHDGAKPIAKRSQDAIDRAIKYLRKHQDPKTGAVSVALPVMPQTRHPGVTAMAVLAYLNAPHRSYNYKDDPFVRNALDWVASLQKDDGSIYESDSIGYVTSLAVAALVESGEASFAGRIEKARDFLLRLQANEESGYRPKDRFFGGVGYGGDERPDLSNTQFAVEAVRKAGLEPGHKFFKAAVTYLERCQNNSETNDQIWKDSEGNEVRPGNDGGAIYLPGESKAGIQVLPDGSRVFISYGSMSYALLKTYLFCDIDRRDPRVRAVAKWCVSNFDLDKHPGFSAGEKGTEQYQGLYYYYYSMAKALGVYGKDIIEDEAGVKRDWARELSEKLLSLQRSDGSFVNDQNGRWREGYAVIATCYATIALEIALEALQNAGG
ncbi:MAG: prenyltransferase/squalene oxidase repeat-containing protein [Planctomycetota bacterium]